MFTPNTMAAWSQKAPQRTITGRETYLPPRPLPCAIVHLRDTSTPSPVRADSSASRGSAEEHTASAVILVPKQYAVSRGDVITIDGVSILIDGIEHRRDVMGALDHLQVSGQIRAGM